MQNAKKLLIKILFSLIFTISALLLIGGITWIIILSVNGSFEWYGNNSHRSLFTIIMLIFCPLWGLVLFPIKSIIESFIEGNTTDEFGTDEPSFVIVSFIENAIANLPSFIISLISTFKTFFWSPINPTVNLSILIQSSINCILLFLLSSIYIFKIYSRKKKHRKNKSSN